MAQVPYTGDGPQVAPDTRAPDDYERIDVNPDQFGAAIGRGVEKAGAGLEQAQKFWGEVQTDKSLNNTLSQGDAIVENFKKLNGQDALNAQDSTRAQLQQIVDQGRANLSSPQQQLEFDRQVRGYQQRLWNGQLSTHALDQARTVSASTNNDAYRLAVNRSSNVYDNPDDLRGAWDDAYSARQKQLQYEGTATPDALIDARNQAGRDVYKTAAQAMAVKDPVRAQKFIDDNREILGAEYAPLADGVRSRAVDQGARDLVTSSRQGAQQAMVAPTSPATADAAPLPTFANMPAPRQQGGTAPAAPAPAAANGLPQEGPMPPARGDGGAVAASGESAASGTRPVSDSSALMASQRIALGREADGDRALLARYHEEQGTPQNQRDDTIHLPPGRNQPLPPPRGADGRIQQPSYQQWRATLSTADKTEFDNIALREATQNGSTLPARQAAIYQTISDRATAQGRTLPGGAPSQAPATPASPAEPPPGVPSRADYDAAVARTNALRAPGHFMTEAEHDQLGRDGKITDAYNAWRATQPRPAMGTNGAQSYPTLVPNKATGRMDTSGAPEIDHSAPAAASRPPGRDTSPTPLPHPVTLRLPAAPTYDHADTSTSLPKPVGGSPALSYFTQAGAPFGISGNYLARTAQIESGGKGNATSSTGAQGLFQFVPSTWARYGNGGNPYDYNSSTMAAVRLAADNRLGLTRALGRAPTDAELYLAHQQGLAGASALLRNPNMAAADALAPAYQGSRTAAAHAIAVNGGDPNGSAGAFAQKWINKFNGVSPKGGTLPFFAQGAAGFQGGAYAATSPTPFTNTVPDSIAAPPPPASTAAPASVAAPPQPSLMEQAGSGAQIPPPAPAAPAEQPRSAQAETYARIQASGASDEVKARAFALARQQFAEDQMVDEQNSAARKARSEKARDGYVQRLLLGDTAGMLQQVARDPNLEPEARWTLGQAVEKHAADMNGGENPKSYGPGFSKAYDRLMATPDDPNRLQSADQIYHLVGPDGGLSLAGAAKLDGVRKSMIRSTDDHAVEIARAGVMKAMHERMSFESPEVHLRDRAGEDAFNTKFVPQYMAAFDKAVEGGKSPWDFINDTKSAEALAERLRPRRKMEADRISALGNGGQVPEGATTAPNPFGPDGSQQGAPAVPPAPEGYAPKGWGEVMASPPMERSGAPMALERWEQAVRLLAENPTPDMVAKFNASPFGRVAGMDGEMILRRVRPGVRLPEHDGPPAPPAEMQFDPTAMVSP